MAIKNRLKVILAEKNMQQNELCEKIKISKSTLSNIISGKQNATLETALDISEALNVSVNDIFFKEKEDLEAFDDFGEMMNKIELIHELYEKNIFTRNDVVNIYRALIGDFNKKYHPAIIDICADDYINNGNEINDIAIKLIYGAE